ncbi:uncharacterized protein MYCFIDRAFT_75249 [Pseudocercospora fijiensis CIRAD86]|uniref:Uncharacterized protein n=1 Tax=Pseudocercospora fijiensis (strain CIRAD86) TaxID=383855 RepID=N1Q5V3_PSEFD|nr:uncharacterized protein MYCFIDRAFT_75249 [Pseudocercospora fijiensis CIRAD86]EME87389.1 hypothetical protein MYCFIDRAFT_75249 [Pseudocercospora fijiensis CIRAD86]
MPSYQGIRVSLQSQYDALVLPEYSPPTSAASHQSSEQTAKAVADSNHVAEVYVPMYAGSQFWILYSCPRPDVTSPPKDKDTTRFYYFKLVINGKVVLSWGCGAENDFSGRVTFGLYESEVAGFGGVTVEKRGFFFPAGKDVDRKGMLADSFEIRVYRAKGRRRVESSYELCTTTDSKSVYFRPSGPVKRCDPKRFYTYALIDPVDTPYATFSYNFRTGGQLKAIRNGGLETPEKATDKGSNIDILTASPSRRSMNLSSPLSHSMLSPPPKEKPAPPPKDFTAKDSIALRRLSQLHQGSPVKKSQIQKPAATFDAMEGLSLTRGAFHSQRTPATSARKLQKKESSRRTPSLFTFGLSKKGQGSSEEHLSATTYHAK